MGIVNRPNNYSANTTISPTEVNDDFNTIYNEFNGSIAAANLATDSVTTAKIADSNVTTAKIADSGVTAAKLSTSAINLASITSSTTQTGISNTAVLVTNLTQTVTVPAGGRKVRIEAQVPYIVSSLASTWSIYIYNSATVTGSPIQTMSQLQAINSAIGGISVWFEHTPSAGSQSYCIALSCDNGTGNTSGLSATKLATMSIKVI